MGFSPRTNRSRDVMPKIIATITMKQVALCLFPRKLGGRPCTWRTGGPRTLQRSRRRTSLEDHPTDSADEPDTPLEIEVDYVAFSIEELSTINFNNIDTKDQ